MDGMFNSTHHRKSHTSSETNRTHVSNSVIRGMVFLRMKERELNGANISQKATFLKLEKALKKSVRFSTGCSESSFPSPSISIEQSGQSIGVITEEEITKSSESTWCSSA